MTQVSHIDTGQETQDETPTFDPRGAFAWTLRGGEMARLGLLEQKSDGPNAVRTVTRTTATASRAPRYETPTFDPRSAFARTLRGGELARRERRLSDPWQSDVLADVA